MIESDGGYDRYTIGIVCALWLEKEAMCAMFDDRYDDLPPVRGDDNAYTLGKVGRHDVAVVCLDAYGTTRAAIVTANMHRTFPSIKVFLMVGICGGVWRNDEGKDVRLGDVIVNKPDGNQSSIVRFGAGKEEKNGFKQGGALNKPLPRMVNAINLLRIKLSESNNVIQDHIDWLFEKHPHMRLKQTGMYGSFSRPGPHEDRLFDSEYDHVGGDTCDVCDPKRLVPRFARDNQDEVKIWYGSLGSDDRVMKNAKIRDAIAEQYSLLGFEMEAAGVMDDFNCTVVRGVCDYSDSHKTKKWQGFAAVAAAAYAKALLLVYVPRQETVQDLSPEYGRRSSVKQALLLRAGTHHRMSISLGAADDGGETPEKNHLKALKKYRDDLLLMNPLDALEHVGAPVDGTCEWIMRTQSFQQWCTDGPPLLWISGRPGRGKTMISSFLIRHLRNESHDKDRILYFFCSDTQENRSDEIYVIKGLLGQLVDDACRSEQPVRRASVLHHFEQQWKPPDYFSSADALWRTLVDMLIDPVLGYTYCIIDGVNECTHSRELLERIDRLAQRASSQRGKSIPKFIITSQETPKLKNLSLNGQCKQLDLDDQENDDHLQKDLRTLVFAKLKQELHHIPGFQKELEQELGDTLINRAEGSFIYINYMIRDLREENTRAGVRMNIDSIPSGLDAFFKRILLRIKDRTRFATTTQILRFIAIAIRPLSRAEVEDAAGVFSSVARKSGDNTNVIYPDDSVDEFLRQCSPLLTEVSGHIVFFHHTARKFLRERALRDPDLKQFHIIPEESHLRVAQFCLKYVFRGPLLKQPVDLGDERLHRKWPCLQYAVTYWSEHARRAGSRSRNIIEGIQTDPILPDPVKSMLEKQDAHVRQNWWQTKVAIQSTLGKSSKELMLHSDEDDFAKQISLREEKIRHEMNKKTPPPLHMFCRVGLLEWVKYLIEQSSDVTHALESLDAYNIPPLMWAAMEGHVDVARYLLEKGADLSATCAFHQTSVWSSSWSSSKFYRASVSYFRHLIDQDATWTGNHTALYRAAYKGHVDMVRLLLEYKADPNLLEWANFNSVHAAVISGNKDVVDLILEKSTTESINAALKITGLTPLLYAAGSGFVEIARELIDNDARLDTAAWTSQAQNVLQYAIHEKANAEMLTLLLENCSSQLINEHNDGKAAIHLATEQAANEQDAIEQQSHAVIALLLHYGADINRATSPLKDSNTALHLAVRSKDIETIEYLISAGANIEAVDGHSKTPLHVAAENGYAQVVMTLLKHNANVEAATSYFKMTPLHLVVLTGRVSGAEEFLDTISVLLEHDAPVNAQNWKHQTPLDKAVNRDCLEMIDLLYDNGGMLHRPNVGKRNKYSHLSNPAQKRRLRKHRAPQRSRENLQRWSSKDSLLTIKSIDNDSESGSERSAKSPGSRHRLSFRSQRKSAESDSPALGKITSNPIVQEPPAESSTEEIRDIEGKNSDLSLEGVEGRDTL